MIEDKDYKSYARYLKESWEELETRFKKEEVNPDHENDVVCFLYYGIAKRLEEKRRREGKDYFNFQRIRTEDTIRLRKQTCRVDINLANRLFVEVKVWNLRNFGIGNLLKKGETIAYYMDLLEKYTRYAEQLYPNSYQRKSVLAIWFRNRKATKIEEALVTKEIQDFFEAQKAKYRDKATILYGPKDR